MTLRARPLPVLALLLAAATALALSVALQRPAAALVSADPDDGTCETNGRVNAVAYMGGTLYLGGSFTQVDGTGPQPAGRLRRLHRRPAPLEPGRQRRRQGAQGDPRRDQGVRGRGLHRGSAGLVRARVAAISPTSGACLRLRPVREQTASRPSRPPAAAPPSTSAATSTSAEGVGRRHLAAFNAISGASGHHLQAERLQRHRQLRARCCPWTSPPTTRPSTSAATSPCVNGTSRRNAAAVSSGIATLRAWSPSLHRRQRRRAHPVGLGQHGVRGRPRHRRLRAGLRPHRRGHPGLEREHQRRRRGPGRRRHDPVRRRPLHHHRRRPAAATWPPCAPPAAASTPGTRAPTVSSAPSGRPSPARGSPSAASSPRPAARPTRASSSSPGPRRPAQPAAAWGPAWSTSWPTPPTRRRRPDGGPRPSAGR